MKRFSFLAAGLVAALSVCGYAAPTLETSRAQADEGFRALLSGGFTSRLSDPLKPVMAPIMGTVVPGSGEFDRYLKEHLILTSADAAAAPSAAANSELDLAALLNRHLKTKLLYTLGGKSVWISGTFDRGQNAYASILEEGKEPRFFNVRGLLDKEEQLEIGSAKFKLYLSPNVFNQMKSEVVLENAANEDEKVRVTIKKLLDSVGAAGDEVKLGDQVYRAFYFDNIKDGKVDKTLQTLAFVLTEASGDLHVFLVPSESVPSDKVAIFKMFKDKKMGLQQVSGKLKVFDLP